VQARPGADVRTHLLLSPDLGPRPLGDASWDIADGVRLVRLVGGAWESHRGDGLRQRGFASRRLGVFEPATALELPMRCEGGVCMSAWALVTSDEASAALVDGCLEVRAAGEAVRVRCREDGLPWEGSIDRDGGR